MAAIFGARRADPRITTAEPIRRKAVIGFLPFEILRFFRLESGGDERGLGARKTAGSISAGALARTAAPAMSAMS